MGRPGKCGLLTGLYKPPPFVILVIARSQPQSDRLRGHDELDREGISSLFTTQHNQKDGSKTIDKRRKFTLSKLTEKIKGKSLIIAGDVPQMFQYCYKSVTPTGTITICLRDSNYLFSFDILFVTLFQYIIEYTDDRKQQKEFVRVTTLDTS